MDAISNSLGGMNAAAARFDRASLSQIKSFQGGAEDSSAALVDQMQAALAFKANAAVLRTAFGVSKSLLDILV